MEPMTMMMLGNMVMGAHQGQQKLMENKRQAAVEAVKTRMSPWLGGQGNVSNLHGNETVGNIAKGAITGMAQGQNFEQAQLNQNLAKALANNSGGTPSYGQDMISSSNSMGGSPWLSSMGNNGQFTSSLNPSDFQF